MAYSTQRVVSDGSLVLLSVSIGYLERQHVHVFFDNIEDSLPWAWVGATNQISFSPAVPNGVEVLVARKTDQSAPYHVFTQGAQFTAESLDEDIWQILYIAQEATEQASTGEFFIDVNMHGYKITNVADAVSAQDVMTLGQAQETMQPYVDAAAASQLAADISEANALSSANASAASAAVSLANAVAAADAAAAANAVDTNAVLKTSATGSAKIPAGTTAERDVSPVYGAQRANSTLNQQEWWNGSAWVPMGGGATGAPGNNVFVENDTNVTGNYTITTGKNAMSAGPITINSGVTVTVPNGSTWSIV